jgi:hypothetical protein
MMKAAPVHHFVVGPRWVAQSPGSSPPICVCIELRFLSPGITRFGRCCGTSPPPQVPGLSLPGFRLVIPGRRPLGLWCCVRLPCLYAVATTVAQRRGYLCSFTQTAGGRTEAGAAAASSGYLADMAKAGRDWPRSTNECRRCDRDRRSDDTRPASEMGRVPKLGMLGRERGEDFANRRVWAAPRTIAAILALHSPCLAAPTIREPTC